MINFIFSNINYVIVKIVKIVFEKTIYSIHFGRHTQIYNLYCVCMYNLNIGCISSRMLNRHRK